MHKIERKTVPRVFLPNLLNPTHIYPTRYSNLNYQKLIPKLKVCKYRTLI